MPFYNPNVPLGQYFPSKPPEDEEGPVMRTPVSVMRTEPPTLSMLLTREMERVVAGMSQIPVPQSSQERPKPPPQVLGLVCKRLWVPGMQAKGVGKMMRAKGVEEGTSDPKDKGKRKKE